MHDASQVQEEKKETKKPADAAPTSKEKRAPRPFKFIALASRPDGKSLIIEADSKALIREELAKPEYASASSVRIFRGYELAVKREVRFH